MKFRKWILSELETGHNLRHFLEMQGMILFFKKGKEYFGAGEDSRMVFARLKHPDEETTKGWEDEASFTATNLSKMVKGESSTQVFSNEDLKKIKIVDQEKVIEALKDVTADTNKPTQSIRIIKIGAEPIQKDRDDAPNFVRADEE